MTVPDGGVVFIQNIKAADGARVNAVQHGDQYNYIYRGTPPYQVEPFPLVATRATTEAMARVPSRLLTARHQVVPFFPRPELALLESWRDELAPGLSARMVHAEGGSGKTRLAQEFAARSARAGWAVALARHRSEVATAGGGDVSLTVRPPGLVLVVDYAERWPLADLITLVRQHRDAARDRLRILLLSRTTGTWWQGLAHQFTKLDVFGVSAIKLEALPDTPGVRTTVYVAARDRFAEIFALDDTTLLGVPDRLTDPAFALTLTVHMRALIDVDAASRGQSPPTGSSQASLSSYLLDREYDYWRSSHDQGRGPLRVAELDMSRAVYVAVLTRSLTPASAATALIRTGAAASLGAADLLVEEHGRCYPAATADLVLDPLAPDRLGEDYLALSMPGHEEEFGYYATDPWTVTTAALLLEPASADSEPAAYARQTVSTLIEAAHRWPHLITRQIEPLLRRNPGLALNAGSAALTRLADLPALDLGVLEAIEPYLPDRAHVDLDLGAAAVCARLADHRLAKVADPAARATVFTELGWRYGNAGLHEQALGAARKAVDEFRAASQTNPNIYTPHLAVALANLGGRLSLTGQRAEAVAPEQEAVNLYRELSQLQPAVYLPDFAAALNGLGNALSEVGRWREALDPAREAVQIRRQQAEAESGYQRNLALALTNLGTRLSHTGRGPEALLPAREAVDLFRQLAHAEPAAHLSDLARALHNLSIRLGESGLRREALERAQEAVQIRRTLVPTNPDAQQDSLAMELNNLGVQSARLGRNEDSLAATQEAVDLYRVLAQRNPAAYRHGLAAALNNLGTRLAHLDRHTQAVASAQEAVELNRALARAEPASYLPNLAGALHNLGIRLLQAGRIHEAPAAAQEAVELYRSVTATGSGAARHLSDLATALRTLSILHGRSGYPDKASEPAAEAVVLQRLLAKDNPTACLPGLAAALRNLCIWLVQIDCLDNALRAIDEAIGIYWELEDQEPDRYARHLKTAIDTRRVVRELKEQ